MTSVEVLSASLADRYRIDREIGAGGMATVYLAEDVRHERLVAIKVLHPELGAVIGAERFLAEIRLTASLQHPHILPLFDSGSADGLLFFVTPYIEGETLRTRLERERQLPVPDAVRIACDVADALSYAHGRGVIHRDIKPENILLHDGRPLVADFGIALAVQHAGGNRLTQTGLSLGTPQYMSPEQAMGERDIDARADIYALGAVTYEMLIGEPPFTGATAQAIVAKLLTGMAPSLYEQRRSVPLHVDAAVLNALEKLPADRPASAAVYAQQLRGEVPVNGVARSTDATGSGAIRAGRAGTTSQRKVIELSRVRMIAALVIVALLAVAGTSSYTLLSRAPDATAALVMATLAPAEGEDWLLLGGHSFAISPQGDRVAIVTAGGATEGGIVIRSLSSLAAAPVAGAEGGYYPFWSPDGESLGFFDSNSLKTVHLASGSVRRLCPVTRTVGGAWGADDVILFGPDRAGPLHQVSALGGECTPLPLAGEAPGPTPRPYFMEDGTHFIASTDRHTYIGRIGDDSLALLRTNQLAVSVYAPPGYLIFREDDSMFAQRIDVRARRLAGEPRRILPRVPNPGGRTAISTSDAGHLVMQGPGRVLDRFFITAPRGGVSYDSVPIQATSMAAFSLAASRAGRQVALGGWGLFLLDVERGAVTRAAVEVDTVRHTYVSPVWAPGDTAIALFVGFGRSSIISYDLRTGQSRVIGDVTTGSRSAELMDWAQDGRTIAFALNRGAGAQYVQPYAMDVATGDVRRLFTESGNVDAIRFSPDGRFIAYASDASGRYEVYVRPFPGPGTAVAISAGGGTSPRWSRDGSELFHRDGRGAIVAIGIGADGRPVGSAATVLHAALASRLQQYDVGADGASFTGILSNGDDPQLVLVMNWIRLLES